MRTSISRSLRASGRFVKTVQALVEGAFAAPNPGAEGPIENDRGWDASEALELLGV